MSLLTITQDAADLIGLPRPNAVASATDTQTRRLLALVNVGGRAMARRHRWQAFTDVATFTTQNQEEQGTLSSIAPNFLYIVNQTMWNRDTQDYIPALDAVDWQEQKATVSTGPYYNYRIRDDKILFYPEPSAGDTVAFEYASTNWCESSGGTGQTKFQADSDVSRLDENLHVMDLRWRFKHAIGLDYAEDFREFEMQFGQAMAHDGGKRILRLDEGEGRTMPATRAPDGSWSL